VKTYAASQRHTKQLGTFYNFIHTTTKTTQYAEKMQHILEYQLPVNASRNTHLPLLAMSQSLLLINDGRIFLGWCMH